MTDNIRLDWLQRQLDKGKYTGLILFRWSSTGRGLRFHETSLSGANKNVRQAIDKAIKEELDGS